MEMRSFLTGLGCGALITAGVVASNLNSLESSQNKASAEVVIEEVIPKKEDSRNSQIQIDQERAKVLFPSLRMYSDSFNLDDIRNLSEVLDSEDSPEKLPLDNICSIDRELDGESFSGGVCIFLTPQLILTNYHVAGKRQEDYSDEFFQTRDTVTKDNLESRIKVVAISPLYDLALVKSDKTYDIDPIVLTPLSLESKEKYTLATVDVETREEIKETYTTNNIKYQANTFLNVSGALDPSGIIIPRVSYHGQSGSPFFEGNKLLGLLVSFNEEEKNSLVSPKAYDFISEIYNNLKVE